MLKARADRVEGFDPAEWDIRRVGRRWAGEEANKRIYQAPEKIEFVSGKIFANDRQRLAVLAMLLENLGIDAVLRLGNPAEWKAAVKELELATNEHERER